MSTAEATRITEELKGLTSSFASFSAKFDALDEKVDKHNGLIERMYAVEKKLDGLCADHCRIQNEKEKKKINWSAILQTIIGGVTIALLVKILIDKL